MKSLPNNHVEVKGIPISKQDVYILLLLLHITPNLNVNNVKYEVCTTPS